MKIQMSVEARMIEYGQSQMEAENDDFVPNRSAWAPILEMQYNAGARAAGFAYEMIDDTPCIPDGGLWQVCMAKGKAEAAAKSNRVAEVREALCTIPREHKVTLTTTYNGFNPRTPERAAQIMGIDRDEFFDRLARSLEWMEMKLCIARYKVA